MRNSRKSDTKDDSFSDTTTSAAPAADAGGGTASSPPPNPGPYLVGDIVLAKHSGRFYQAKVEKVEFCNVWRFFIHYRGWKKSWDEWVETDRLMKPTEENLQKVSHDKKQSADVKAGHLSGKRIKNNASMTWLQKKRDHATVKGGKDNVPVEKLVNISIPPMLKAQLMDDFESINQMGKLVKLPRIPNVNDILEFYRDYRGKKDDVMAASVGEVLSGLLVYFNKALPVMLLYNKERQQYEEATVDNASPSAVYGAEHLLRLFVKLPALLYELNIEEKTLRELQQILQDFLKYLQKNQSAFFLSAYHAPNASEGGTTDKDRD
uniref:Uncharacterized protein n=1 Tax=Opuntia streptacantha TaxID=393608 RepID=A0A7C9A685_OPUST